LPISEYAAQNPVFSRSYFCASIGGQLKIELEIVNAMAIKFVFNNKGEFVANRSNGSGVGHSERVVSNMRGAQEVVLRFPTRLYRANSRSISKGEKAVWTNVDAILFCAIDQQRVVRPGASEPVSHREVPRIAAGPGVTENFLTVHTQNKAELVIVSMAAFA
jgi:hypothetical protein